MLEYTTAKPNVRMRILRAAKGWNQTDTADKIGVSLRTYQRWENGDSEPYPAMRDKIHELYGRNDVFESSADAEKGE